jgi:hypothetical protein
VKGEWPFTPQPQDDLIELPAVVDGPIQWPARDLVNNDVLAWRMDSPNPSIPEAPDAPTRIFRKDDLV